MIRKHFLSWIYILLAFSGAYLTISANIEFIDSYGPGFDIIKFISLANINPAAKSLSSDLLIGASAVFIWIISESKRLNIRNIWLVILSMFTIAFAFGAPLFLFLRERRLIEIEKETSLEVA